jgi:insertion element IS1 protein InsB
VVIQLAEEAEADEMWSFVQRKKHQRWLWHAIDRHSGKILAYVFGRRQRHIDPEEHQPGKRHTQKIEVRPVGRKEALASG